LRHQEPKKNTTLSRRLKAGSRYYLQRNVSCSDVHDRGRDHEPNQPNAQISDLVERPLDCRVRVSAVSCESCLFRNRRRTYLVTANTTRVANIQGGAQSRRVTVGLCPSVAVRVGKNTLGESEVMIQVRLHAGDKLNTLPRNAMNDALQCHVYNLPICQSTSDNLPLALDFGLTFIANASVLFHPLLSQSDLDQRQRRWGVDWKSGRTNVATRTARIVRPPSM
jgi:hypothetical protein